MPDAAGDPRHRHEPPRTHASATDAAQIAALLDSAMAAPHGTAGTVSAPPAAVGIDAPDAPVQLAALSGSSDLATFVAAVTAAINAATSPGQAAPDADATATGHLIVVSRAAPSVLAPSDTGSNTDALPHAHNDLGASTPAAVVPGHNHPLDDEPGAFGSAGVFGSLANHQGRLFIGTLGQDVFHGTRGADLFDFVTVPNSLQSGDSITGGGGQDVLKATFDAPATIDHTLLIADVPRVDITIPGGTTTFDAGGISGVSSLTLHGPGNISLTGGSGIDSLVVTDAGHTDTLGGFAHVTYDNAGDPSGLHPTTVDLIDIPAGGTQIDFLGNHLGDTLVLPAVPGSSNVAVTVSGAEQIMVHGPGFLATTNLEITVTGTVTPGLQVSADGLVAAAITFDTTGPVTASVTGFRSVVGSNFDDNLTVDSASVSGGAGNDTITALSGGSVIEGGAGDNVLTAVITPNGGVLSYQDAPSGVVVDLSNGITTENGYGGFDRLSEFRGVIGSTFNDVITTDDYTQSVVGNGGADTVHLGGTTQNFIQLVGGATVDIAPGAHPFQTDVYVTGAVGDAANFNLSGGVNTTLEFDEAGPTNLQFSNSGHAGSIGLVGVEMIVLRGGNYNVTFDGTILNGGTTMIDADYLASSGGSLQFDGSLETGQISVRVASGLGNTLIGTSSDALMYGYGGPLGPGVVTLETFANSTLSGIAQFGSSPTDIANSPVDHFTNFGTIWWQGLYPAGPLIITDAVAADISTVDLQAGRISGAGGSANVYGFGDVTNESSRSLYIAGPNHGNGGIGDVIIAGSGDDTITAGTSADTFIGGSGADHFLYEYALESNNQRPDQIYGPDLIENFHDSGNTSVLDVAQVSTVTQHFTGDKGTLTSFPGFAAIFGGDHAGDVDYVTITNPNATGSDASHTYVHVASGTGYSSFDLIVNLQGAHVLTAANFHLHP